MIIYANSGSVTDIQNAVDQVEVFGNGTVHIPATTSDFIIDPGKLDPTGKPVGVLVSGGVNIIGEGAEKTILHQPADAPFASSMFFIDGRNGKQTRISGIWFQGYVNSTESVSNGGVTVLGATDYRIDHCKFTNFSGQGITTMNTLSPYGANRGLIDHCDFDNPYKGTDGTDASTDTILWGYGISPIGTYYNWNGDINTLLGKYDDLENIVYIEDCAFNRCRHGIASTGGVFYVVRHCIFTLNIPQNFQNIDVHGSSGPAPMVGGRGLEAYNNDIIGPPYPQEWGGGWHGRGLGIRGGGGVIYNNLIIDCEYGALLQVEPGGQEICKVIDLWLWNNTMKKNNMGDGDSMTYLWVDSEYTENQNYFLYEKSEYIPYLYPHPLQSENGGEKSKMETADREECLRLVNKAEQLRIQGRSEEMLVVISKIIDKILKALA